MATNGTAGFAPSDVLGAVMTMRSGEQEAKKKAHEYLEQFQKSVRRNPLPPPRLSYSLDFSLLTVIAFLEGLLGDRNWNPPIQG
jgi:hypothetical protein